MLELLRRSRSTTTTSTGDDAHACVQRGAHLLDARLPGWYRRVDLSLLGINSPSRCILAQAHPEGFSAGALDLGAVDIATYGFAAADARAVEVEAAWADAIHLRLAADLVDAEVPTSDALAV